MCVKCVSACVRACVGCAVAVAPNSALTKVAKVELNNCGEVIACTPGEEPWRSETTPWLGDARSVLDLKCVEFRRSARSRHGVKRLLIKSAKEIETRWRGWYMGRGEKKINPPQNSSSCSLMGGKWAVAAASALWYSVSQTHRLCCGGEKERRGIEVVAQFAQSCWAH
ncbi:30S ribosomal protein S12 [Candidatus Hodgkinia cicadicola]|nr:30S ribosomal protein S12 [Candidatus Hodgkinia cicadicola]